MQDYKNCCTLGQIIGNQGVLVLDVVSDMNNLFLSLLAELFNGYIRCGQKFLVILDGLAITEENGLKAFLSSQNNAASKAVAGEDVFSSCGCDDNLFRLLVGKSQKWFVFNHMSDASAKQWSAALGMYEKIETSFNYGRSAGDGAGFGGGGVGWSTNTQYQNGETLYRKDEARIRSFEIQQLGPRQGLVYTRANNELAYIDQFVK